MSSEPAGGSADNSVDAPADGPAATVTSEEFRHACGRFPTGITIASVVDLQGTPHGLTVSSFTSVSLEPPLILICLGHLVTMIEAFRAATHFGVNVLGESQQDLSERFARKGHDRFLGVKWYPGRSGVPLIEGALAAIECQVHQRFLSGDHDILVGRMLHANVIEGTPLVHWASQYRRLAGE
jgi:flavin reductase (DIM6/NTAB) family NADH-FMN oxidoreductase RutF